MTERKNKLRSARWFAPDDLRAFGHRSRAMQMGYSHEDWQGKPAVSKSTSAEVNGRSFLSRSEIDFSIIGTSGKFDRSKAQQAELISLAQTVLKPAMWAA